LRVVVAPVDFAVSNQKNLAVMGLAGIEKIVAGEAFFRQRRERRGGGRDLCLCSIRTQKNEGNAEKSG